MKKRIVIAGMIGEILEWYDFTLYGFLAPILATLFFPTRSLAAGYLLIH